MNPTRAAAHALTLVTLCSSVCFAEGAAEASKETSRAEVEQCVAQHDSARQLRLGEQWQGARAAMTSCADERCPLAIAADCRAWLDELESLMPTLIIVVEGEDLAAGHQDLRVELDGTNVALKDPPTAIELLPGAHRLRFEMSGQQPVILQFSLQKGEKNHIERLRFVQPEARPSPATTGSARLVPTRPVPAATYWLSAGALAAFASSAAFLYSGLDEHADAQAICAPNCSHEIHSSIQARLLLADISAGAGLVLGALSLYTYLRRPVVLTEPRLSGPAISANGNGASVLWGGRF